MLSLKQIRSFLRAVWSFVRHGDAPLAEHDRRQAICLRCEYMSLKVNGVFCEECRCPHWAISDLRTKWRMRDLKCPLNKWQGDTQVELFSQENIARAFTEWERRYREEPERFQSEAAKLLKETPETYGEACAPYFLQIIREVGDASLGDWGNPTPPGVVLIPDTSTQ